MDGELWRRPTSAAAEFGGRLRALRESRHLTQEQLAARSTVSVRSIAALESGAVLRPRWRTVDLLADALELDGAARALFAELARGPYSETAGLATATGPGLADLDTAASASPDPAEVPADPADLLSQLPSVVMDFTGREQETADAVEWLTSRTAGAAGAVPIWAVCGPGGVGKSTLCVRIAHLLRPEFSSGQLFVDMQGMADHPLPTEDLVGELLLTLGLHPRALPQGLEQRAAVLRGRLAGQRWLIVLDNAGSAAQVRPFIPGSSGCAVLVSSRSRLAELEGARHCLLVPPSLADCLRLLEQVVGRERVCAESAAATAVVELCDRLPLAVRIAGARLAVWEHISLQTFSETLADERARLDQLALGDAGVRTSLARSYAALADAEKTAFKALGDQEISDLPDWVLAPALDISPAQSTALLERLADVQLVSRGGATDSARLRYRVHDLVRIYARERSDTEDPAQERIERTRRSTSCWLALAEQANLRLPMTPEIVSRGSADRYPLPGDVVQEVTADPVGWFDTERANLVTSVLAAVDHRLDETAWELAAQLTSYLLLRGHWGAARRTHQAVLGLCRETGNRRGEAASLVGLAASLVNDVELKHARDDCRRAYDLFLQLGDVHGKMSALLEFGSISTRLGDYKDSAVDTALGVQQYERALLLAREVGDVGRQVDALQQLGVAYRQAGDLKSAERSLAEATALLTDVEAPSTVAQVQWALAKLLAEVGKPAESEALLREALGAVQELDDVWGQAQLLYDLGMLLLGMGRDEEAAVLLSASLPFSRHIGHSRLESRAEAALASLTAR